MRIKWPNSYDSLSPMPDMLTRLNKCQPPFSVLQEVKFSVSPKTLAGGGAGGQGTETTKEEQGLSRAHSTLPCWWSPCPSSTPFPHLLLSAGFLVPNLLHPRQVGSLLFAPTELWMNFFYGVSYRAADDYFFNLCKYHTVLWAHFDVPNTCHIF